jgi:hypothetical protein
MALADIGAEENPPCSAQNIHQLIERALAQAPQQSVAEIRLLEVHRLDQLLAAVWSNAMAGDLPAVDRCLAIMYRRARLLGLDLQTGVLRFRDYEMGEGDDQPQLARDITRLFKRQPDAEWRNHIEAVTRKKSPR